MNGLGEELQGLAARLERLSGVLFNREYPDGRVRVENIVGEFPDETMATMSQLLRKMSAREVVYFDGQSNIDLYGLGKYLQERGNISEYVLGFDYIDSKYRSAVVRIVVTLPNGDPAAGTGFFISDPPNHVITNRHVAELQITQIEDMDNNAFHHGNCERILGPEDLDLGVIQCEKPAGLVPLRIAWKSEFIRPLAEVLVLGYPVVAGLLPGLHHGRGKIGMIGKQFNGNETLILSELTDAGGSGGPVINVEGMVVGVLSQQNIAETQGHVRTVFVSAVPSSYLRSVVP